MSTISSRTALTPGEVCVIEETRRERKNSALPKLRVFIGLTHVTHFTNKFTGGIYGA
jgi:hypothetical protein